MGRLVEKCYNYKAWGMMWGIRENLFETLEELKEFHICRRDIAQIEGYFSKLIISI